MLKLSIKNTLLVIITVLSLIITISTASRLYVAFEDYQDSTINLNIKNTVNLLSQSSASLARERGITNSAINSSTKATEETKKLIDTNRNDSNDSINKAFEQIRNYSFINLKDEINAINTMHENLNSLRIKINQDIDKPKNEREIEVIADWVPTVTKLIEKIQKLSLKMSYFSSNINSNLLKYTQLENLAWTMSEFAGRERATFAGIISNNTSFDLETYKKLIMFRTKVETSLESLKQLLNSNNISITKSLEKAEIKFFQEFEDTRKDIYYSYINSKSFTNNSEEWFNISTAAINSLLDLSKVIASANIDQISSGKEKAFESLVIYAVILALVIILSMISFWVIVQKIANSINKITDSMNKLAKGNLEITIDGVNRHDEIGSMAKSLETFKNNAIKLKTIAEEKTKFEQEIEAEKKASLKILGDRFNLNVRNVSDTVSSASVEMEATAQAMLEMFDNSKSKVKDLVNFSTQAANNVNSISLAAKDLSASVSNINDQVLNATAVTAKAVKEADEANINITDLSITTEKIGAVISLITGIAEKINLLALNASIEAARAGEAGKGFTVVASEVKNLANQTAKATMEISSQILSVQLKTKNAISSMTNITKIITSINEISNNISSTVQHQSEASQDIARNIQEASAKVQEVSNNSESILAINDQNSHAAHEMFKACAELAHQSTTLNKEVDKFIVSITSS